MLQSGVKLVRFAEALGENSVEVGKVGRASSLFLTPGAAGNFGRWRQAGSLSCLDESQPHADGIACRDRQAVKDAGFCAGALGIHHGLVAVDNVFVERVFEKAPGFVLPIETAHVGLVVTKQQFGGTSYTSP